MPFHHARRSVCLAALVLGSACASERPTPTSSLTDAVSSLSAPPPPANAGRAASLVRRVFPDAARVGTVSHRATPLVARAPTNANGALHLSIETGRGDTWTEVTPEALTPIAGTSVDGMVVYADAARSLDLVYALHPGEAEELRVLRDERAPTSASWTIAAGAAIRTVRAREGRFELLDERGRALLQTAPLVARDALGVERAPSLDVQPLPSRGSWRLRATLDTSALTFPIVLDPLWTTEAPAPFAPDDNAYMFALKGGKVGLFQGNASYTGIGPTREAVYDLATNTWSSTTVGTPAPNGQTYFLLDGVAVRGGDSPPGLQTLDIATLTWKTLTTAISTTSDGYRTGYFVELPDGTMYLQPPRGSGRTCNLATGVCTADADSTNTQTDARAAAYALSTTAIFGVNGVGVGGGGVFTGGNTVVDLFIGPTLKRTTVNPGVSLGTPAAVGTHGYIIGGVIPAGGTHGSTASSTSAVLRYDAGSTTAVTTTADMPTARADAVAVTIGNDIVVMGGVSVSGTTMTPLTAVDVYDSIANSWRGGPALLSARRKAFAVAIDATHVFIVGGATGSGAWSSTSELLTIPGTGGACTSDPDCAGLYHCVDGVCCLATSCSAGSSCNASPTTAGSCSKILGTACAAATECGSRACSDGVCCDVACSAPKSCALPGHAGHCLLPEGAPSTDPATCASGFSADGVCCATACNGTCEACAEPGHIGACSPVTGAPRGTRTPCVGDGSRCSGVCDGKTTATCATPAALTPCGIACSSSVETRSQCDGSGHCVAGTPRACGGFACTTDNGCLVTCAGDAECATGFQCRAPSCVPATAKCSDDRHSSIGGNGATTACGSYLCESASGACRQLCSSSDECAPGFSCDSASHTCNASGGQTASTGGCTMSGGSDGSAVVLLVAFVLMQRRRTRAARKIG